MADKEEGMHMLQISLDNLQVVLPNTNVAGRDNMRQEMQTLQAEYDALSGDLNDTRNKLDGTLAQWTVYDDSIEQLRRWLNDLENQIHTETQLQNTLQEKKLQLDRIKVGVVYLYFTGQYRATTSLAQWPWEPDTYRDTVTEHTTGEETTAR